MFISKLLKIPTSSVRFPLASYTAVNSNIAQCVQKVVNWQQLCRKYFVWTWGALGWTWTALKAHSICCGPLVVALSNNLKSKKYYLSKFHSNKSGKWGKMAHVIFDLLFSNENYAQRATSSVQAYFIEKTDKRVRISKM